MENIHREAAIPAAVFLQHAAHRAMLEEVYTTPKPGLVDRLDSGAHTDMDLGTFKRSAEAVAPYMGMMAAAGYRGDGAGSHGGLFQKLRAIGVQAEKAMFSATGGVNTHKGMIFSMGLAAACCGECIRCRGSVEYDPVFDRIREMTGDVLEKELAAICPDRPLTHGEALYLKYGAKGIRGEAAEGFPSVRQIALPLLTRLLDQGMEENLARLQVLTALMAFAGDTNVLSRSGPGAQRYMVHQAKSLLKQGDFDNSVYPKLRDMNRDFIARNISPGGCADLLAITIFMHSINTYKEDQTE